MGPVRSWVRFWFGAADPVGLHVVRVLAGLPFLAWLLPFATHQEAFFGFQGWSDIGHLAFLIGFALVGWRLAIRFMERKLIL